VPPSAGWVVAALGAASAVLGVAFALGQHDLKRLLAYHSVENIGIILVGLGFGLVARPLAGADWGRLALAGGLLHVWNHGLFKALLFLGAGSVLHATGTREMSKLGGLWRAMPWTTALFALGAVAISGLPPLNGFVSEWLVYVGLFEAVGAAGGAGLAAVIAVVLLALTGALALACFIKVCGVVFLGAPRSAAARRAHESPAAMRGPMLVLAGACVAIGLAPFLFWPAVARAAGVWHPAWSGAPAPVGLPALGAVHVGLALLLTAAAWRFSRFATDAAARRAVTWDCGYAHPSPRMQYTAGSFAATIVDWFRWILAPQRHAAGPDGFLPARAHCVTHTPETVLDFAVAPAGRLVLRGAGAARRMQHGRVQAYLVYLLVGLAGLAVVALGGGGP
jgi:hydrogenase-4 component B